MGFSNSINTSFDVHHLGHARAIAHTAGRTSIMADLATMKSGINKGEMTGAPG